jgi:5-aminopentanamidase
MRIACVQSNVVFSDLTANIATAVRHLEELKARGVDLVVFPEAFLTGYCVSSISEASAIAIDRGDLMPLQNKCDQLGIALVVGFAELANGTLYNAAALIQPKTEIKIYHKTHLPELGLDKFVVAGDELPVFDTMYGKIGLLICFDLRIPEAARVLALKGAELIILPTNWPEGAEVSAEFVSVARSAENRVFLATCNRVGEENGFNFVGRSKIITPSGQVVAAAGAGEEVLTADIDLAEARIKRNVMIPGHYETTVFDSRRPELYGVLVPAMETETEISSQAPALWV